MSPQDVNNMSQWLQELLKLLQETRSQLADSRNENRQLLDEIKAVSSRLDHKDSDTMRMLEMLKSQVDTVRTDVAVTKSTMESHSNNLDSKINDLKSAIQEVRNIVR